MGSFSIWHILVLAAVVILLFGRGKISDVMGDFAVGIRNFRKELGSNTDRPQAITTERQLTDTTEQAMRSTLPK
jgi:sec-independent protein translocase protein TatA